MKRIQVKNYGGPEVLEYLEYEAPAPGKTEVLIALYAAGVNPVDTYRREGSQGYEPELPFCPGSEGAGVIEQMGSEAMTRSGLRPGDRVYVAWSKSGCYAQSCIADISQVFPIPLGMSFPRAAALFVNYFTAYRALVFRGGIQAGDRVLVHGASGGVGVAALQWLNFLDNKSWATAGSDRGLELCRSWASGGWAKHNEKENMNKLAEEAGGFDIILEMRADINLEWDLESLRPGGRIMVIGSRGEITMTPRKTMAKETDIRGVKLAGNSAEQNTSTHSQLTKASASGDIDPVIAAEYPLKDAAAAHSELMSEASHGKRILTCR